MNCGLSHDQLWLWAVGEQDADSAARIETHVSRCDHCQEEVREMRGVVSELRLAASQPAAAHRLNRAGPYEIIREIGRGGMGVVYEAEQKNPARRVALKLLAQRAGTDDFSARLFRREVQALARLHHPGIAAIHDAGRTDDGLDYYVMEFVNGFDLVQFANGHDGQPILDLNARLRLFLAVCDAVAYAHQRGIIHRDLKPGNILVRRESPNARDASPQPVILDFGLARAVDTDASSASLRTEAGRIMGTLRYMSPEQARGRPDEIDARTDVYALGVILYEFLTASAPYDLAGTSLPECIRIICEQSPRPPRELNPRISHDVQTIILKAIEKERERRYPSVDALRDDLQRFLTGHPILARPASAADRFIKLVRRHRLASALIALLAATVGISFVVALLQARRIAAESERVRIESRTVAAVNSVLEGLLESADPWSLGRRDVRVLDVLDGAARRIDAELADSPLIAAAVHNTLGRTYRAFADFEKAERHLRIALDTRRRTLGHDALETARTLNDLGELFMLAGRPDDAEPPLRTALDIRLARLPPLDPEIGAGFNNLGLLLKQRGDSTAASKMYDQALRVRRAVAQRFAADESAPHRQRAIAENELAQTLNNLAALARAQRRLDDAEALYREALSLRVRNLDPGHPDIAKMHNNLGRLLLDKGDATAAVASLESALQMLLAGLGQDHPFVAGARHNLALALQQAGDRTRALSLARLALDARRRLLGDDHDETRDSIELVRALESAITP